ncbi:hypothetical protein EW146_g7705 [Bondarzewia mesenterica]|uniref:Uncharacterized protein n=1 Tax=Bondarzewia mesenterica TaxID=1095465 RepID=A0A4S4LQN6_9AGAM|nr:hypothetical protein EW146_g7705 [Bondarzewia mesenterica]
MTALDLHHTIFTPEPSFYPTDSFEGNPSSHTRHPSSISTTTLYTSVSPYSHPTEPLLSSFGRNTPACYDLLSRQPLHPDGPRAGWDMGLNLDGDPVTSYEKKGYWEQRMRSRLRRLRTLKGLLELLIGAWALYNTIRYFIAYVIYTARDRQIVALALGISSLLSFTLALVFSLRSLVSAEMRSLLPFKVFARTVIPYLTSFFLVRACARELHPGVHLETFVAAGAMPLGLGHILTVYHATAYTYRITRRPSSQQRSAPRGMMQKTVHVSPPETPSSHTLAIETSLDQLSHPRSSSVHSFVLRRVSQSNLPDPTTYESSIITSRSRPSSRMPVIPDFNSSAGHSRHSSGRTAYESMSGTEDSHTMSVSGESSGRRSLRRVRSMLEIQGSSSHGHSSHGHSQHGQHSSSGSHSEHVVEDPDQEDLQGFADRFRSLVSQVTRDIEQGLRLGPDAEDIPVMPPIHNVLDTHQSYMTFDEFGRPVPSDERIPVLGGFIKRMPTIDSVGSRERGSWTGRLGPGERSTTTSIASRPPTRATMLSMSASNSEVATSQPPSRSNSLNVRPRAESASELGEALAVSSASSAGSRPSARSVTTTAYHTAPNGLSSTSTRGTGSESRSRSNSLGAIEALAPVTELGELNPSGRGEAVVEGRPSSRSTEYLTPMPSTPSVWSRGGGRSASEMGEIELGRASEDGSGSGRSSSAYYSATSGSGSGSGGVLPGMGTVSSTNTFGARTQDVDL